jgi:hypothetical protein
MLGKDNPVADRFSRLVANNVSSTEVITTLLPPLKISAHLHVLIGKVHNCLSGHHGLERTLRMLTTASSPDSTVKLVDPLTPKLRIHIKQFIAMCPCCQKMSMIKVPIHSHPFTTSRYYPMERSSIDFIGLYPDKGYTLTSIDSFTRWVKLYYSPAATGKSAAEHLFQNFGRFWAPTQLLSDRGSHFMYRVIKEFISLIGTEHCLTLAYSSKQNSIAEGVNKEINRHIGSLTFESNSVEDYKSHLSVVQRILDNAAYSDRTRTPASQMLFCNAINLDRALFLPPLERLAQGQPLSDHMSKMLQFQDEVMTKARRILQQSDDLHNASKSTVLKTSYLPGSYILVKYRNSSDLYPAPTRLVTL